MTQNLKYRSGYKYQLIADHSFQMSFAVPEEVEHKFFKIKGADLLVKSDYAWNGADYAIDTKSFIVASLVHDVLFQAFNEGLLNPETTVKFRKGNKIEEMQMGYAINEELVKWAKKNGMPWWRRLYVKLATNAHVKKKFKLN